MSDLDESLEQLFRNASPRPVPSEADIAVTRNAIRTEWRTVSGQHRSRKRRVRFAIAATILIGVFSLFSVFRVPTIDVVRVAAVQKTIGSIYVLGEHSELTLANDLTVVFAGQTIVTAKGAGMALSWGNGGSLRLDEATEVNFRDGNTVHLRSGRIYFDSMPSELIAGIGAGSVGSLTIETEHGIVSHVGTQFMTGVDPDELKVSVREGQVEVVGQYSTHTALRGEQVVFSRRQRPVVLNVVAYGDAWDWVARTSPAADVDGKSVHAFLTWAGRELGMRIEYADDAVESLAHQARLEGRVDSEPSEALRLRMLTAALDWYFAEGVIYVSVSN